MDWIQAFVWTCAIEAPIYILFLRGAFRSSWAPVTISLGLQLATHPLQWLFFPSWGSWTLFFLIEIGVALVEGMVVALVLLTLKRPQPILRGFLAGFLANALSAAVGVVLQWV